MMGQLRYTPEVVVDDLPVRPSIYNPLPMGQMYGIHVPVSALRPIEANKLSPKNGFVMARTRVKPWVLVDSPDKLVRDLAQLEAQNMPRDEYFRGKKLRLFLSLYKVDNVPALIAKSMHGLKLIKVEVVS